MPAEVTALLPYAPHGRGPPSGGTAASPAALARLATPAARPGRAGGGGASGGEGDVAAVAVRTLLSPAMALALAPAEVRAGAAPLRAPALRARARAL